MSSRICCNQLVVHTPLNQLQFSRTIGAIISTLSCLFRRRRLMYKTFAFRLLLALQVFHSFSLRLEFCYILFSNITFKATLICNATTFFEFSLKKMEISFDVTKVKSKAKSLPFGTSWENLDIALVRQTKKSLALVHFQQRYGLIIRVV